MAPWPVTVASPGNNGVVAIWKSVGGSIKKWPKMAGNVRVLINVFAERKTLEIEGTQGV
jgi:hypothetical protein